MVTQGSHRQEAETALKAQHHFYSSRPPLAKAVQIPRREEHTPVCMLAGGEDCWQPLTHVRKKGSHPKE